MKISVIIPTYNRCNKLRKSLESFLNQTITHSEYEILVINDGSNDRTRECMTEFISCNKNVFYFEQDNKGPASARNIGIKHAKGKYLFFTGDDIIASRNLLKTHLEMLELYKDIAVLGFTTWNKSINVTKFMDFLIYKGYQFDYRKLKHGQFCSYKAFYTSNISLEKHWFDTELFDGNFPYAAWEDIELGYRLCQKGLKIIFNEKAIAFHHHEISEKEFYNRVWLGSRSELYIYKKHPELKNLNHRKIRTQLILLLLKGRNIYNLIFRFFRLYSLVWKLNICYYNNLGILCGLKDINYLGMPLKKVTQ
jgi:glycosyltransferase involved in cell wall biosynthesis